MAKWGTVFFYVVLTCNISLPHNWINVDLHCKEHWIKIFSHIYVTKQNSRIQQTSIVYEYNPNFSSLCIFDFRWLLCRGSAIAKIVGRNAARLPNFNDRVTMYVYEEDINGKKLTEIINTTHENVKYLPGHKLPENVVSTFQSFCSKHTTNYSNEWTNSSEVKQNKWETEICLLW